MNSHVILTQLISSYGCRCLGGRRGHSPGKVVGSTQFSQLSRLCSGAGSPGETPHIRSARPGRWSRRPACPVVVTCHSTPHTAPHGSPYMAAVCGGGPVRGPHDSQTDVSCLPLPFPSLHGSPLWNGALRPPRLTDGCPMSMPIIPIPTWHPPVERGIEAPTGRCLMPSPALPLPTWQPSVVGGIEAPTTHRRVSHVYAYHSDPYMASPYGEGH